jgi:hypothetical protein
MGKFAKLFDIGEEQVLVHTETDKDDNPTLRMVTDIDGVEAAVRLSFGPKDGQEETFDIDKAWAACDRAFDAFTEVDAVKLRDKLVNGFCA